MSLQKVSNTGDEYYTPKYIVEILIPYLKGKNIKKIWCPCDKRCSEYVKTLKENDFDIIYSHIAEGKDFLIYNPNEQYDAIVTNPPFSIKNKIFQRCIEIGKPFALLMSATAVQSASFIRTISKAKGFKTIMFDKRISYSGDRPPFPSWYFTSQILDNNEFYIYKGDPKKMYKEWMNNCV